MEATLPALILVILLNLVPHMEGRYNTGHRRYRAQQDASPPSGDNMEHVWSGWGRWTPCSLTCGEGTRSRRRECVGRKSQGHSLVRLDNPTCPGKNKEYTMCQERSCSLGAEDLFEFQCTQHDDNLILNQKFEWVPYRKGPNVCELICMAKGYGFTYNFGHVTDGTSCSKDSDKICIEGRCASVGCDGKVGSNTVYDNCLVCNGQNANCALYNNSYDIPAARRGSFDYTDIVKIPKGAAHIRVEDFSDNYLAVRDARGQYIINGNWIIDWSGRYDGAGTTVVYNRTGVNETVEAKGPTKEELSIVLMFRDTNPGVKYSFFLPREQFKDVVVPRGSQVTQSDSQPDPQGQVYNNGYGRDSVSNHKPHKPSGTGYNYGATRRHNTTSDNTNTNSKIHRPDHGNPWDKKVDSGSSNPETYLQQWLRAFSPGTDRPIASVTPWANPVYTLPPRTTPTTRPLRVYTHKQYVLPTAYRATQIPTRYPVRPPIYPERPPSYPEQQPSYPERKPTEQAPSYPELQPSHLDQSPSYPERKPGYLDQSPSYPERKPGYLDQSPSYPDRLPSYPERSPHHPDPSPSYPKRQPSYPELKSTERAPSYPERAPSYPERAPSYPKRPPSYPNRPSNYPENFPQQSPNQPESPHLYPEIEKPRQSQNRDQTTRKHGLSGHSTHGNFNSENRVLRVTTAPPPRRTSTFAPPEVVPPTIIQYNRTLPIPEFFRYRKPRHCGTCRQVKGLTKSFCSHDFVVKAKVLDYQYFGNNTRYDIRIHHTFKNTKFQLLDREYIWVPNRCRCPDMGINRVFLMMGNIVANYRDTNDMRLVVNEQSFVRKFNNSYDRKLKSARKRNKCTSRG